LGREKGTKLAHRCAGVKDKRGKEEKPHGNVRIKQRGSLQREAQELVAGTAGKDPSSAKDKLLKGMGRESLGKRPHKGPTRQKRKGGHLGKAQKRHKKIDTTNIHLAGKEENMDSAGKRGNFRTPKRQRGDGFKNLGAKKREIRPKKQLGRQKETW